LASLRAKINRKKSYPRIAQKRGMQGTVKIRFTILRNGHVGNITVSGPKVFHNSAKGAVKKAFPISVKNAPLRLPTTVNLSLRYKLR
jgi:protein TonB